MALKEYRRKRRFDRTPEPKGSAGPAAHRSGPLYIIQKHAASRLHYDFRLELDGVLKSWAVPKGPSLDPAARVLAVHVEDHPIEYGSFEGAIPQGQYGGGTVMLWDRGVWEPIGDARAGYKEGHLKFKLYGERLHGGWALIRMRRKGDDGDEKARDNWLLIKEKDESARPAPEYSATDALTTSVATGRTMEEIAHAKGKVWRSNRAPSENGSARPRASKTTITPTTRIARAASKKPAPIRPAAPIAPGDLPGARKAAQPPFLSPQLATLVKQAPTGDEYLHEAKLDGYRIIALVSAPAGSKRGSAARKCRLLTRRGNDWTDRFPALADAVLRLPIESGILDGELVVLNKKGVSEFQSLQNALKAGPNAPLVYYLFDAPFFDGYDLTRVPLLDRKRLLRSLIPDDPASPLRYSDHIQGNGAEVFRNARRLSMEGIVSKRADSRYEPRRSKSWLKTKCVRRQEFVVGGYTDPAGARSRFGALLLGFYGPEKRLLYCGKVGTGFTEVSLVEIHGQLRKLEQPKPAFANPPSGYEARTVHWLKPQLVAEIEFAEWTSDGKIRHPSFHGIREDKRPEEVVREDPAPDALTDSGPVTMAKGESTTRTRRARPANMPNPNVNASSNGRAPSKRKSSGKEAPDEAAAPAADPPTIAGVTLSNPDRVLYPEQNITKLDLARYYEAVAEFALPHMIRRPLSLVRCPRGRGHQCFFQKHPPKDLPPGLRGIPIKEKTATETYILIDDLTGLISLVQMGVLEIHPWGCREDKIEQPDRLTFDFDPGPEVTWRAVIDGATTCRDLLQEIGLESWVKTSGGKGLHVVVPLMRRANWDEAKAFAHGIADEMVKREPTKYIATMSKAKRTGKIFVDYLRNGRGATSVAAYSTRARPGAPVSAPLRWEELDDNIGPASFTIENLPARLRKLKKDPWTATGFCAARQSISGAALKAVGL